MDMNLENSTIEYQLIFLQPRPEIDERVCVGIRVGQDLRFDQTFRRAKGLLVKGSESIFRVYLNEIRDRLRSKEPSDRVFESYRPLIHTSSIRRVAKPVTDERIKMLLTRYIGASSARRVTRAAEIRRETVHHIEDFALSHIVLAPWSHIQNARASEIFGSPGVKAPSIALALKTHSSTVLIDGVDLNVSNTKSAIEQTDKLNRKFWLYRRLADERSRKLPRIALVFNGNSHASLEMREAHDYALDQFKDVADLAIDASRDGAEGILREFVEASS
jgi:hypothetical protein